MLTDQCQRHYFVTVGFASEKKNQMFWISRRGLTFDLVDIITEPTHDGVNFYISTDQFLGLNS